MPHHHGRRGDGRQSVRRSDSSTARHAARRGTVQLPPGRRNPRCLFDLIRLPAAKPELYTWEQMYADAHVMSDQADLIDCDGTGLYGGTDIWSTSAVVVRGLSVGTVAPPDAGLQALGMLA